MSSPNRTLFWEIVIVTAVVVVVVIIAFFGLDNYYNVRNGRNLSASTIFYMTLQLFTLNFAQVDSPAGAVLGWRIEFARFAAPLLSSYAIVRTLVEIFADPLKSVRISLLRNHVVICGLSQKGFALVKDFRARRVPVVLVEWDKENDLLENCRDLGAHLVMGDATEEVTLRKAGAGRARLLFAVCDEDGANAEIGMNAQAMVLRESGKAPLETWLHIEDLKLCALLRAHGMAERKGAAASLRIFNIHENAARYVLKNFPLDGGGIGADDPAVVRLIVIGFSRMGETLAVHAAQTGHYANGSRVRLTLIDRQMNFRAALFRARYPRIEEVCGLDCWHGDYEDPKVLECIERLAHEEHARVTIAVCLPEDGASLACALRCAELLRERGVPILVRLDRDTGLAVLAEDARVYTASRIRTFVVGGPFCSEKELVEKDRTRLARAIHEDARARKDGSSASAHWNDLDEETRNFSRQAGDHVAVKLRALGCDIVGQEEADANFKFSQSELELLAQMEHRRWCASRLLAGYRRGEADAPKDKQRKIHPLLTDWEQLSDAQKQRARRTVARIPEWLATIGKGVRRI